MPGTSQRMSVCSRALFAPALLLALLAGGCAAGGVTGTPAATAEAQHGTPAASAAP